MTEKIMPLHERDTSTSQAAADAFLSSPRYANPNTHRGCTSVLYRLLAALVASRPLAEVSGEELAGLMDPLWGQSAPFSISSAATSRTCSRRARTAAVSPPPSGTSWFRHSADAPQSTELVTPPFEDLFTPSGSRLGHKGTFMETGRIPACPAVQLMAS
jgi:hypothetical protein